MRPPPVARPRGEAGAAMVVVLLVTALLGAIGLGLVSLSNTELAIAANQEATHAVRLAADAALERALADISGGLDVNALLGGVITSPVMAGTLTPAPPWGGTVDLGALTAGLQAESDAGAHWGANDPRWRLVLSGPLSVLVSLGGGEPPLYVAVWIADDPSEADGDPLTDENGIVQLTARACGPSGRRSTARATVARDNGVRILAWRESEATAW